jgi:hypothetical protein
MTIVKKPKNGANGLGVGSQTANKTPPTARRPRPAKPLPTDRILFSKQLETLRGFAAASGSERNTVSNDDVAPIVKLKSGTISLTNSFFCDVGFLEKVDGGFVPTVDVLEFNRGCSINESTAPKKLANVLRESWFAKKLLPILGIRKIPQAEAIELLADEAGATGEHKEQLAMLITYLKAAGLVRVDPDGSEVSLNDVAPPVPPSPIPPPLHDQGKVPQEQRPRVDHGGPGGVNFQIDVHVDMADMASWAPERIAALFAGIAQVLAAKNVPMKEG